MTEEIKDRGNITADSLSISGYVNTREAARICGVSESTMIRWISSRGIPAAKVGRAWAIRREGLESLRDEWNAEEERRRRILHSSRTWRESPMITPRRPIVSKDARIVLKTPLVAESKVSPPTANSHKCSVCGADGITFGGKCLLCCYR